MELPQQVNLNAHHGNNLYQRFLACNLFIISLLVGTTTGQDPSLGVFLSRGKSIKCENSQEINLKDYFPTIKYERLYHFSCCCISGFIECQDNRLKTTARQESKQPQFTVPIFQIVMMVIVSSFIIITCLAFFCRVRLWRNKQLFDIYGLIKQ